MARHKHGLPCTIVIKLGTSSIVHETTHQPLLSRLSAVVETVLRLKAEGHKVVLVSSGAIGVGLKTMNLGSRPKNLAGVQALAAIGQGRLIALWDNLFGQLGQSIAQVLITRGDIADRTRYLNAVNTLTELLSMGIVPIVNENDTISISEIKFGDNDTLSAITSAMLHADYLFLLTDVDGLYTTNPRKDPSAKPIDVVTSIQAIRSQVSTKTLGSKLGTGGMETKLIAAEIATAAGVATVISSSAHPERIFEIIEYNNSIRSSSDSMPSTPREPLSGRTSPAPEQSTPKMEVRECLPSPESPQKTLVRPPHTMFMPSPIPLRDLKSWTSHTLAPAGSVIIDAGAHLVLSRRDSGGRLLPAGVLGVKGTFASGQAVRIVVRKRKPGASPVEERDVTTAMAKATLASYGHGSPFVTEPSTPILPPVPSSSSSILSLDQLPRATSADSGSSTTGHPNAAEDEHNDKDEDEVDDGWDLVEVGRGLANYNSAQIRRVKGMKSSNIPHVLGYADSEYVVENITIRIPPS
ncbi:glutamate 5-kinase [Fomitiporia mediterranea MF3/22]|uniref:glutamate 5-kinase n=1 Tax=Fomitiporia mediterranea (strain MF3/22) TaxID=694068 RepID=UPI0004408564|nr:glutamate 5-kinase [Fomitiporia mediterranea MF3/22]EJD06231.1 glutamate 5-kinase [Fomitiporia mediterranea MF3/22]